MDTITTMFVIDCAAGGLALVGVAGALRGHFAVRRLRTERDDLAEALRNEQTEGDHWRELALDGQANIEDLQERLLEMQATCGRWAGKFTQVSLELRRIHAEREEAAARKAAHMRSIAALGNRSPKRRLKRRANARLENAVA
jgi:hypothetical protein